MDESNLENNNIEGKQEGEICNRDGCTGVIENYDHRDEYPCVCHTGHPPCNSCASSSIKCSECDFSERTIF